MTKKTDSLFKEVLQNVNPGIQDLAKIRNSLNTFLKNLEFQIKNKK